MTEYGNGRREGVDELDKYEFKTVKVPRGKRSRDAALNRYGAQGWEVISVRDLWQGYVTVSMKRVRPEKPARVKQEEPARSGGGFWGWLTGRS